MNDFEALTTWVQPRHLSASGIEGYRADFKHRPVRVLHVTDFLKADMVARIARFLGREATYEQVYTLYGADENGKRYRPTIGEWPMKRAAGIPTEC